MDFKKKYLIFIVLFLFNCSNGPESKLISFFSLSTNRIPIDQTTPTNTPIQNTPINTPSQTQVINSFSIQINISGFMTNGADQLSINLNQIETLSINSNSSFNFQTKISENSNYTISISSTYHSCTGNNLTGTITQNLSINISCIYQGYILEIPNIAAAYSLRKLNKNYTGPAINVQNSSGANLDIGFDSSGDLDRTALLNHTGNTGASTGRVRIWYDQSGKGMDISASVIIQMPMIVISGILQQDSNGKVRIRFVPNDQFLRNITTVVPKGSAKSIFYVANFTNATGSTVGQLSDSVGGVSIFGFGSINITGQNYIYSDGVNGANNTTIPSLAGITSIHQQGFFTRGTGTAIEMFINRVSQTVNSPSGVIGTESSTLNGFILGRRTDATQYFDGNISEVVLFSDYYDGTTRDLAFQDIKNYYKLP